jgi:DNA-binding NtrC family response regulator
MREQRILFVDENIKNLENLKNQLQDETYQSFFAIDGEEAISYLQEYDVDVVLAAINIPVFGDRRLLEYIGEYYSKTVRIAIFEYAEIELMLDVVNKGEMYRVLIKPWKLDQNAKVLLESALNKARKHKGSLYCEREGYIKEENMLQILEQLNMEYNLYSGDVLLRKGGIYSYGFCSMNKNQRLELGNGKSICVFY